MLRNRENDSSAANRLEEMVRHGKSNLRRKSDAGAVAVEERPVHHASDAPALQAQALAQMESMLERLERDIERRPEPPIEAAQRVEAEVAARRHIEDVVLELQSEVQRLSREVARLSAAPAQPAAAPTHAPPATDVARQPQVKTRPAPAAEPQFQPGGKPLTVNLAGVPDFEALMEVQRALSTLQQVAGVSVIEFEGEEATLHAELRSPLSARHVAAGLRSSAGRQFLIEESRPDERRLRLRFIDREERPAAGPVERTRLRPDLWPKA
jgi:hypothetical protein